MTSPESSPEEYDVFISYASEDEDAIAMPLAGTLRALGLRVWIDTGELSPSDILNTKLLEGIERSRYFVPIVSPRYLSKHWTLYELNNAWGKLEKPGSGILPVVHQMSPKKVEESIRRLGGIAHVDSGDFEKVVLAILRRTTKPEKAESYLKNNVSRRLKRSFAITAFLAFISLFLVNLPGVNSAWLAAYHHLIMPLSTKHHLGNSVSVFDISEIKPVTLEDGIAYTPRAFLTNLIASLADLNPAAIGIDIDFSPMGDGAPLPHTPALLDFCQTLSQEREMAIFLGVERQDLAPPERRFGLHAYEELSASIAMPRKTRHYFPYSYTGGAYSIQTLSAALAQAYHRANPSSPRNPATWESFFLTDRHHVNPASDESQYTHDVFYADYGAYKMISTSRTFRVKPPKDPTATVQDISFYDEQRMKTAGDFGAGIFLVGDASNPVNAEDVITLPGDGSPTPGIYAHACAAATLIHSPVLRLKRFMGTLTFLLLAIPMAWLSHRHRIRSLSPDRSLRHSLPRLSGIVPVGITTGIGLYLAVSHQILWLEVPAICLLFIAQYAIIRLLAHPRVVHLFAHTRFISNNAPKP